MYYTFNIRALHVISQLQQVTVCGLIVFLIYDECYDDLLEKGQCIDHFPLFQIFSIFLSYHVN